LSRQTTTSNRSAERASQLSKSKGTTRSRYGLRARRGIADGSLTHVRCESGNLRFIGGRIAVVRRTSPAAASLTTRILTPIGE